MGNAASTGAPPRSAPPPPYYNYPPPPVAAGAPAPAPSNYYGYPRPMAAGTGPRLPVAPPPEVERQRTVPVNNDLNFKKDSLRVLPDGQNPGCLLVSFAFDAAVDGRIIINFFAQEDANYNLKGTREGLLKPVTAPFKSGQGQEFVQPSGTGIDVSLFKKSELTTVDTGSIFPITVELVASPSKTPGGVNDGNDDESYNSRVILAIFVKKNNAEYAARVLKQILWIDGIRYEVQEIYGIVNSVGENNGDDSGKECVVCLSEPRDTTLLPCSHMCVCRDCARSLQLLSNRCPMCRQPVERLLEIEVAGKSEAS